MNAWRFAVPERLDLLWLLPLVLVAFLVLRRRVRVIVAELGIWERALATLPRRRRFPFRLLLSMLVQAALFAALILAWAGPYRSEERRARGHTILAVDHSLGTRMRGLDARLDAELRTLVAALEKEGSLALARWSEQLAPFDPRSDPPSRAGTRDLGALLEGLPEEGRRILLTPFDPGEEARARLQRAGVVLRSVGALAPNAGIRSVRRTASRTALAVRLEGKGGVRELELWSGDRRLSTRKLVLEGNPVQVEIPLGAGAEERLELRLVPEDAFPADDRVPLVLSERARQRVLFLASAPTPEVDAWFRATERLDVERSARFEGEDPEELFPDYDLVIAVDRTLKSALPSGRYLLLNSEAPQLGLERVGAKPRRAELLRSDADDPLVRGFDLRSWNIEAMVPLRVEADLETILEGSAGPLLTRGERAGRRFLHLGVSPRLSSGTLVRMEFFPLLLDACILELAGARGRAQPCVHRCGGRFLLEEGEEPWLRGEDGERHPLRPLRGDAGFALPKRAGRYEVAGSGRAVALALLDHPGLPHDRSAPNEEWEPHPREEERHPFTRACLIAAAALLLLQGVLLVFDRES